MPITIECSRCGHIRTIDQAASVRGAWSQQCPVCQPNRAEEYALTTPQTATQESMPLLSDEPRDAEERAHA